MTILLNESIAFEILVRNQRLYYNWYIKEEEGRVMDILILLAVIYIALCLLLARNISRRGMKSSKIYRIAVLISSIIVMIGCLTPLSFVHGFILGDTIVLAGWIVQRVIQKKQHMKM